MTSLQAARLPAWLVYFPALYFGGVVDSFNTNLSNVYDYEH